MLGIFAIISSCDPLFAQIVSVISPVKVAAVSWPDRPDIVHNGNASKVIANVNGMRTKWSFMVPPPLQKDDLHRHRRACLAVNLLEGCHESVTSCCMVRLSRPTRF